MSVCPNHSGFTAWLCRHTCVDNGATAGAGSDSEPGPLAASRKAGYAGPGGAWPLQARLSYRRRRQARRSQGGHPVTTCDQQNNLSTAH